MCTKEINRFQFLRQRKVRVKKLVKRCAAGLGIARIHVGSMFEENFEDVELHRIPDRAMEQ